MGLIGKYIVDFVGKVEAINQDVANVIERISGESAEIRESPKLNQTQGEFELSDQAIEKINSYYRRDFKFWDYEMYE